MSCDLHDPDEEQDPDRELKLCDDCAKFMVIMMNRNNDGTA